MHLKKVFTLFLVIALLSIITAPVAAEETDGDTEPCGLTTLFDGWARASVEGAPNSAVYGLLVNLAHQEDTLINASTSAAEFTELHEMIMGDNDTMRMSPVGNGFNIPAHSYTELKPGGLHIMLINLTAPLVAGEEIELTLTFETGGEVTLSIPVKEATASMGMGMGMPHDMDMGMNEPEDTMMMTENPADWGACTGLHVLDPWVRPAMAGGVGGGYAVILNLTDADDALVGVSSPSAEVGEIHEMVMDSNDVMRMRPLMDGILLPAGGVATLQPGGLHLMLINLTNDLEHGDTLEVTLTFASGAEKPLTIPVRDSQADTATDDSGHSMGGHGH